MQVIWLHHFRTLLTKGLEVLQTETRILGCRLQRGFASRNLLAREHTRQAMPPLHYEDVRIGRHDAINWKLWYRDIHVVSPKND